MDITLKRDGITLRGKLEKPNVDKCPIVILFHGFTGDIGYTKESLFGTITDKLVKADMAVIRFDFNGHGKSDGNLADMDILNEIEDAIAVLRYVQKLEFVTDIYILGHSQGGVVGGMLAGYYSDVISKLVLLAPAAALKDDAKQGICMGTRYDTDHIPDVVHINNTPFDVGGHYFRIAKHLPIYEITQEFKGPALAIHGLNDNVVDVKASYRYKDCMNSCELEVFKNLDHIIQGEDREEALDKIVEFFCK